MGCSRELNGFLFYNALILILSQRWHAAGPIRDTQTVSEKHKDIPILRGKGYSRPVGPTRDTRKCKIFCALRGHVIFFLSVISYRTHAKGPLAYYARASS